MKEPIAKKKSITNDSVAAVLEVCYLDYAKFIIENRSIPYFFDGFKQINRRLLWVLHNDIKKHRVKCARVVGDTIGKYHPHGDQSSYLTLVRMGQDWVMRYRLINPQGNFGNIGDGPAQMRYTECSLSSVGASFFMDFDRETIPMKLTYDRAGLEPVFLPTRFPNLLMNGTTGIAIGISTSIPPHRCCELFEALIYLLRNPGAVLDDIMEIIQGPDFPCAVLLSNRAKIREIYATGEGSFVLRAPCEVKGNKLIFRSIPHGTSKEAIILKLIDCKEKKLIPITNISDESTAGLCLVIKIHQDADINVAKSLIYKYTQLSHSFSNRWFALDERGAPRLFNMMTYLRKFNTTRERIIILQHRNKLYNNRAQLAKYLGYIITLENPEQVINILKTAKSKDEMRKQLMALSCKIPQGFDQSYLDIEGGFCRLSSVQVDYIIELKLHQIGSFKKQGLLQEIDKLKLAINYSVEILNKPEARMKLMIEQYEALRDKYKSPRRTTILEQNFSKNPMDFIEPEDVVISISEQNYIKQVPLKKYSSQRAGGRGLTNSHGLKIGSNTRERIMLFTDKGRVFKLDVYKIPSCDRGSKGRALINLLPKLQQGEQIKHMSNFRRHLGQQRYIIFAFANGNIRKNRLEDFKKIYSDGKIYNKSKIALVSIIFANDEDHLYLITHRGKSIRFAVNDLNLIKSRSAQGVRGIFCDPDDRLVSCTLVSQEGEVLIMSENGIGKKTDIKEFRAQNRGGKGMLGFKITKKSGPVAGAVFLSREQLNGEVMLINSDGRTIRIAATDIPKSGRNTSGNKIMQALEGGKIVNIIPCEI
jgi:DNA gyrase subunit A